ncbi:MAG: hypothetical protein J2P13_10180 [Acidobacteria bacterium]|nr:hypothetical protein [Acidobacteriota bacterium]
MNQVIRILRLILREIFEEAAYDRFCTFHGVPPGRSSYFRFLREKHSRITGLRCC